jgi:hypothetical protein
MKKFFTFVAFVLWAWFLWPIIRASDPKSPEAKQYISKIHNQVAEDAVKQFELSMKGKNLAEICVHAGIVVAAYLQAKDEKNYLEWKKIEKKACKLHQESAQSDLE